MGRPYRKHPVRLLHHNPHALQSTTSALGRSPSSSSELRHASGPGLCNTRSGNSFGPAALSWCRGMPRHQLPIFGIPWSCNTTVEKTNGQ